MGRQTRRWTDKLLKAIEWNDVAGVQQALRKGADVNGDYHDRNPLAEACFVGNERIVGILLDAGADVRGKDSFGESALMKACSEGHTAIVEMLIHHNADEYCDTTEDGMTALMFACEENGNPDIVGMLLAEGLENELETRDNLGHTALHHSAIHSNIEVLRELVVEYKANIFAADKYGRTPFDAATRFCADTLIHAFLIESYSIKMKADNGRLALHEILKVAEYSFAETEEFHPPLNPLQIRLPLGKLTLKQWRTLFQSLDLELIKNRDDSGKLPIHIACSTKAPVEVLTALVDLDPATLQIADYSGNLPIHECCFGAVDHSSVQYLVEQGGVGTLAARNRQGLLPLHILCGSKNPPLRTVQYLIQSFPESVAAQTDSGEYPFMIAAAEISSASLSVVYELVRAKPDLVNP